MNNLLEYDTETAIRPSRLASIPRVVIDEGGAGVIERLAADWRVLCDEASNDELFYRPEWLLAYLRAFAADAKLVVFTCRLDGRLTGVLPLIRHRTHICGLPVRGLWSLSNLHSPRFDLLRAHGPSGDAAVDAIWDRLRTFKGWDLIQLMEVPEDGAAMALIDSAAAGGHPTGRWESKRTPIVHLSASTPSSERWFAQSKGSFRKELRRCERKLGESGAVQYRVIETADPRWLEKFYALERSGWKGASGSAITCQAATKTFYDELARCAGKFGSFLLHVVESGDKPVAASYGIQYRDRLYTPKMGVDEQFRACSPGQLTVQSVLHDCVARELTTCDFMGASSDWESRWTSVTRPHQWIWIFQNSLYGRLLHAGKFPVREAVKRIVKRLRRQAVTSPLPAATA